MPDAPEAKRAPPSKPAAATKPVGKGAQEEGGDIFGANEPEDGDASGSEDSLVE